jgi:hypothetical protein
MRENIYRVFSINVDVAEMCYLNRGPSCRFKYLGLRWCGLRESNRIRVDSGGCTETEQGVTELSALLSSGRNRSQVMGNDRSLLTN